MGSVGSDSELVVWRLLDGKPGHENQTLGLVRALQQRARVESYDIPVERIARPLLGWLMGRFEAGNDLPDPQLILGAGHATHLPMLAARRARGGRAVVLMKPSLPLWLFDCCVIPEHDAPPKRDNVIATRGVLNAIQPHPELEKDRMLILLGGLSKRHGWDNDRILRQVRQLLAASGSDLIVVSDSRRTPAGLLEQLNALGESRLECHSHRDTPIGWVAEQLSRSHTAWVSEDSVSMVYEALTAGCRVGLIGVPRLREDRVIAGIKSLLEAGMLRSLLGESEDTPQAGRTRLDEASRVAGLLMASLNLVGQTRNTTER